MFLAYEQKAVSSAVLDVSDLTGPPTTSPSGAMLQAETQNVRYTMDGTAPTVSTGMILVAGAAPQQFLIDDLVNIKFIRDGGSDAALNVHWFGGRSL